MFEITVLFLYIIAGVCFASSRWPGYASRQQALVISAYFLTVVGIALHLGGLWRDLAASPGLTLTLGNTASFVGLQLAVTAAVAAGDPPLRGLSGGLLILAAGGAVLTGAGAGVDGGTVGDMSWQIRAHVLISLFAYGLLSVGAIVAVYALIQDRRLRRAHLSPVNALFAPLETTEKLLFGVTATGFVILLLAVFSGLVFVENLFAQHLVHKTVLSFAALLLFGVLLAGRRFRGWRGRRAVWLYLWGFVMLGLAYFGSRYVLESILGRSWG